MNSTRTEQGRATTEFGYCTNVHAGTTLELAKSNLLKFASAIQGQFAKDRDLLVGLWLAEDAAQDLVQSEGLNDFGDWLRENRFAAYTFNGFPQGDFHQAVVKHAVYKPTWLESVRCNYTINLARILANLIPHGQTGSISTLPLGWPHREWSENQLQLAAQNLLAAAKAFHTISEETGREIVLAIEPEPGCILNTADEIIEFFERFLLVGSEQEVARRHLTVCHDICHSGVMFEPQKAALRSYLNAGIRIGKVQVSSAVHVPWDQCDQSQLQQELLDQLKQFNEPKYLHQTTRCNSDGQREAMLEDLAPALLDWIDVRDLPTTPWRIHFHVPIFVGEFGRLATTRDDISEAVSMLEENRHSDVGGTDWFTGHYEVETYAWPVLPPALAVNDLSEGISKELQFFSRVLDDCRHSS